ncbi:mRNA turnover and ribosome assembly protein [Rhizina undulata]
MPRSKRSKVVSLTQTTKKPGRENNERLFSQIRECIDEYQTVFVFSVDNMRNTYLKDVRSDWSDSRLFFGKTKVMAKSLGLAPEDEYRAHLSQLTPHIAGNVGLFFTNRSPQDVLDYFETFVRADFARMNFIAPMTFTVPEGIVYSMGGQIAAEDDVPLAHSLESTVRGLGMPTRLRNGKVTLDQEFLVCKEGQKLDSKQAALLKLFGCAVAEFKVKPLAYWNAASEEVKVLDAMEE